MSNFEFNISSANSDTRIINPRGTPADVSNIMQRIKCILFNFKDNESISEYGIECVNSHFLVSSACSKSNIYINGFEKPDNKLPFFFNTLLLSFQTESILSIKQFDAV